jgi:ABC-type multidrug transport system ATPase subunit
MPRVSFAAAPTPAFSGFSRESARSLITFEQVGKTYRSLLGKRVEAVADVSFVIAPGEVVGIAGPNGAGKSTLIAMLLGLLPPTRGRVTLDGRSPRDYAEREGIGYLPELIPIDPRWRADTAITRLAVLAGVPAADVSKRVDEVVALVGLTEHRRKRCKQLSKGNLQKVGLAQSLLTESQVYVFDEPTHGLDPMATQQFRDIIRDLRRPERSMLIASHNLDELERMCDRVAIIDHGRIQRIVDLKSTAAPVELTVYRIRVSSGASALLAAFPGATESSPGDIATQPLDLATLNAGLARAIGEGTLISSVNPVRGALEREFHAAVRAPGGPS